MSKLPTPQAVANVIRKQIKTPKDLPKPIQIAATKGLRNVEMSIRQISKVTGLDKNTVMNYLDTEIEDDYIRYSDAISKIVKERNDTLTIMAGDAMQGKLKDVEKTPLRDITQTYKVLTEMGRDKHSQGNLTQLVQTINVHPALSRGSAAHNVIDGEVEGK
jgi:hypothetical protein